MTPNIVYFDLETQRTANDAGGWDKKRDMGMSVGVTYSTASGQYQIYSEKRVHDLVNELLRADLVVGFNVINFDYEVLMGYTAYDLPSLVPTLDLLVELEKIASSQSEARECEKQLEQICREYKLESRVVKEEPGRLLYQKIFETQP